MQDITTISSIANLLAETLRDCDIDPARLFSQANIDLSAVKDPDTRVPTHRMLDLWNLSIAATDNPCLGLLVARHFQPAVLHGLGFAWLASDTLLNALNRLVHYSRIIVTTLEIGLEEHPDTTDVFFIAPHNFPNDVHAPIDLGMAMLLHMCQVTAGEPLLPVHTTFQRPAPPCRAEFDGLFGPSIEYDAPVNRMSFDSHLVNRPLGTAHPELARINDQAVVDYLARYDRSCIAMQVCSKIIEQLPDGIPSQENIADTLHLGLRSLQRRLKEEETSFKYLLEDIRHSLAEQYLRERHHSIGEITYLLGFSSPSSFTRAFKRWTGKTPVEYRQNT